MAFLEDDNEILNNLVGYCNKEEKVNLKLSLVHNICQVLLGSKLEKSFEKSVSTMENFSRDKLIDPKFMKAVNKRNALVEREPVTYFGDEIPKGDMYDYDAELEQELININFMITTFLGNVMTYIKQSQSVL